ncbi:kinesin-like protein KIF14 [Haliotis rufescens]|uniref:kinesin-like protein KIF14 n=1 Tax=Haliotis rufescens TaxID=6454 RepID=UPI00201F5EAC|nr:kinesin-like protein KIF14 [Haliotis rufescens]
MSGRINSPKKATPKGKSKRLLPYVPSNAVSKGVTFNEETVETSIGGTQSTGMIKPEAAIHPLSPMENNLMSRFVSKFTEKLGLNIGKENKGMDNPPQPIDTSTPDSSLEDTKDQIMKKPEECLPKEKKVETLPPKVKKVEEAPKKPLFDIELGPPCTDPFRTPTKVARRHTLESRIFRTPDCYKVVQMETPRKYDMSYDDLGDIDSDEDSCTSVTVAVRVRPLSQRELLDPNVKTVVSMNGNETTVTAENGLTYRFAYDFSFWSCERGHSEFSSQQSVYDSLAQPLLGKAFEGYNTCLFAYGQTGSGKSYSIMGHGSETGIIPRFCEELFTRAENFRDKDKVKISVEISFFEIYNEKIHDLLMSSKDKGGKKPTLKVREHPVLGPYVEGLSTFVVNSFEDVKGWITLGNKNRATAATGMNDKSSRSHSVFTIVMTQTRTERLEGQDHDSSVNSKINLVDLAGSERQSAAQTSGERLREGANINKSLMTLGKVISLLSDQSTSKKKRYIPYRDSVLTWLLKESLGGNSKTAMIATISPANHHTEETLSTLRYAKQARSIVNVVRVNEDPKAKIIRELRSEIEKLRGKTAGSVCDESHTSSLIEIATLRDRLMEKEREMDEMSRSWQERLRRSEEKKVAEGRVLEKSGIALKVDNKLPNLVNLNEDPQLSEMLLYVIKEGQTRVGRMSETSKHDIQLNGALIADNHCIINNVEGVISITPIGDAPTYVNGNLISEPTILHHADRVILGGDHYFRFNHPMEVQKGKKTSLTSSEVKDFEFAKQELLRVQEARLQCELDEARRQAQQELVEEVEKARKEAAQVLDQQKTGYEDRLAQLEQALSSQSLEARKAEEWRQEAEDIISKLKKQKMMLEQEVLAGRRRQVEEAQAAEKTAGQIPLGRSRLLELLHSEKQKAVENLEKLKQKRTEMMTPSKRQRVPDTMTGRTDLYKVALLLREANKISQYLKKNTTFSREDILEDDQVKPLIKVTNTKHNICTYWTLVKFEEKLLHMRDLFQNEGESCSEDDEVFHDPGDSWERDPHLAGSPLNSPQVMAGYHRSPLSSCRSSQLSSSSSYTYKRLSLGSVGNHSSLADVSRMCKDLVARITDRHSGTALQESFADKILCSCHDLRLSVLAIVDSTGGPDDELHSQERHLLQLAVCLQQLSTGCSLWAQLYEGCESSNLTELLQQLVSQLRTVSGHVAMFIQGCENELRSMVQESGMKIIDSVIKMCRQCGEIALVTDTHMTSFDVQGEHRHQQLAHDVCQAFLSGGDSHVDRSLQDGVQSLEETECRAQALADQAVTSLKYGDLPQHIEIVVSTNKVLLQKCQEIQIELDTSMRDSSDSHLPHFYQTSFRRSQALLSHINSLVDTASLLVQSAVPVLEDTSGGDVRRVYRCAELIQKAALRMLSSAGRGPVKDSGSDLEEMSVLSDSQAEQLEYAGQEVNSATISLMENVSKFISADKWTISPGRGKRLLPISPEKSPGGPVPSRCVSVKKNIILVNGAKS